MGAADSVVLCGLEAAGGDAQLVASVLQLQTIAAKSDRWAGSATLRWTLGSWAHSTAHHLSWVLQARFGGCAQCG